LTARVHDTKSDMAYFWGKFRNQVKLILPIYSLASLI